MYVLPKHPRHSSFVLLYQYTMRTRKPPLTSKNISQFFILLYYLFFVFFSFFFCLHKSRLYNPENGFFFNILLLCIFFFFNIYLKRQYKFAFKNFPSLLIHLFFFVRAIFLFRFIYFFLIYFFPILFVFFFLVFLVSIFHILWPQRCVESIRVSKFFGIISSHAWGR